MRACDWCRKQRIKCDNHQPCFNCKSRGGACSNEAISTDTQPHAYREIDRLRNQVRDLERQLQQERGSAGPGAGRHLPSPPDPDDASPDAAATVEGRSRHQRCWRGILIRTARSPHETWCGPSSLYYYFLGRMTTFINSAMLRTDTVDRMLP